MMHHVGIGVYLRILHGIDLTTFKADICPLISPILCPSFEMVDDNLITNI